MQSRPLFDKVGKSAIGADSVPFGDVNDERGAGRGPEAQCSKQ
jgi:hypothetical protein